ncbi:hypothetical protein S7335_5015 [Synechococcus sp. PCC 7335]|nr:hypothetical protein S7335_5015 [Synechococcus sp. PCC 7335]
MSEDLGMALSTISRFLNGKPVDYGTFLEICDRLSLDWRVVADSSPTQDLDLTQALDLSSAPALLDPSSTPIQDWGEAIDIDLFCGREAELSLLKETILTERCRLVMLLGIGGVGKTYLATKLAQAICSEFDAVIWRSVRNAPPLEALLQDLVPFLSWQQDMTPTVDRLLHWLRTHRCLLILDNMETILSNDQSGQYRAGYENYGNLLRQIGQTQHSSCLLITGREKPTDIGILESNRLVTRSIVLRGSSAAATAMIKAKKLIGSSESIRQLSQYYDNNPLVLRLVSTSIQSLFEGDIERFLEEEVFVFNSLRRLLDQQFERLSSLEQTILYWLAINREWTTVAELQDDIWPSVSRSDIFEALESLSWRSLIETRSGQCTQQPVIMEYVTERLIQTVYENLETLGMHEGSDENTPLSLNVSAMKNSLLLCTHALSKTTTKDYVRASQQRMNLTPLADKIRSTLIQQQFISSAIQTVLSNLKQILSGYGAGNILNLARSLSIDLSNYDFSKLAIWQADLVDTMLNGVNFTAANFRHCQFNGTFGGVTTVALSPDNTLMALADHLGNIHLWQLEDNQYLRTFRGHTDWVYSVAFSPDGQYLVSGSGDSHLKLWAISNSVCIKTFKGHSQLAMSAVFSPDGQQIASGSSDQTIKLWDLQSGQCQRTLVGHTGALRNVVFSEDGRTLASGSIDQTIRFWDRQSGHCFKTIESPNHGIWEIDFSPNGQLLVSGGNDQTVRIWNVQTGACIRTLTGHQNSVWTVAFDPSGNRIVSGSYDGVIKIWNVHSGECEKSLLGHTSWMWSVVFSKDGKTLYSSNQDRTVRIWNAQTGYCLRTLSGYTNTIWSLAFSANEKTLASGSHDKNIRLWNLVGTDLAEGSVAEQKCSQTIPQNSPVLDLSFFPNSEFLASAGGIAAAELNVWDLNSQRLLRKLEGHSSVVRAVAIHPDGDRIASAGADRVIKLWSLKNGLCLKTLAGHKDLIWTLRFSHDGTMLASAGLEGAVKLWDFEGGTCLKTLEGHKDQTVAIAFSKDDRLLGSVSVDTTIKLWNLQTDQCDRTLTGHTAPVVAIAFSPTQPVVASGSFDGSIKIWDMDSGQCIRTLQEHSQTVSTLDFSPNGKILASGGEDSVIRLWDTQSWQCGQTIPLPGPYEGMNISGATGLSEAQKLALKTLGAAIN